MNPGGSHAPFEIARFGSGSDQLFENRGPSPVFCPVDLSRRKDGVPAFALAHLSHPTNPGAG